MKPNFYRRYPDVIIAIAILLSSSITAIVAYANILKLEELEELFLAYLPSDKNSYYLVNNASCVGEITTELEEEGTFVLSSNGELRLFFENRSSTASFTTTALFNPLGQLTDSNTKVNTSDAHFSLKTDNINPVYITLSATIKGKRYSNTLTTPGPIFIRKIKDSTYKIEYPQLNKIRNIQFRPLLDSVIKQLDLEIIDQMAGTVNCKERPKEELDINEFVTNITRLITSWKFLLSPPLDSKIYD